MQCSGNSSGYLVQPRVSADFSGGYLGTDFGLLAMRFGDPATFGGSRRGNRVIWVVPLAILAMLGTGLALAYVIGGAAVLAFLPPTTAPIWRSCRKRYSRRSTSLP